MYAKHYMKMVNKTNRLYIFEDTKQRGKVLDVYAYLYNIHL